MWHCSLKKGKCTADVLLWVSRGSNKCENNVKAGTCYLNVVYLTPNFKMAQEYMEFKGFQYNSLGKKIIDEDGKLQCIFKDVYGNEQLIAVDKQQLIAANMLEEEQHVDHPQPSTSAASTANCNLGSEFAWNRNTTLLLISKYKLLKDDFRDPKIKKKGLWATIRDGFLKEGYAVTEELLDRKFRNLKKTYTGIKDTTNRTGRGRISWEHFDSFEDLFREDKCVNLPRTISSIAPLSTSIAPLSNPSEGTSSQTSEGREAESTLTKSPSAYKMSMLCRQRKKQLELEEKRITEITLLRKAIEKNNDIQKERNEILQLLLEKR